MGRLKAGLLVVALVLDAAMFNSAVDHSDTGLQTDFVWLLPPVVLAVAVFGPLLLLVVWARKQGKPSGEGGDS